MEEGGPQLVKEGVLVDPRAGQEGEAGEVWMGRVGVPHTGGEAHAHGRGEAGGGEGEPGPSNGFLMVAAM